MQAKSWLYNILFILTLGFSGHSVVCAEDNPNLARVKQQWTDSGYSFEALKGSFGIRQIDCLKHGQVLSACLVALNVLSNNLLEPVEINITEDPDSGVIGFSLDMPKMEDGETSVFSEAFGIRKRNEFISFSNDLDPQNVLIENMNSRLNWFFDLYKEIFSLAEQLPEKDQAFMAGNIYNVFLKNFKEPHTGILPAQSLVPTPVSYAGIGANISPFVGGNLATVLEAQADDDSDYSRGFLLHPFPGSPAEKAGLRTGDIVTDVGDLKLNNRAGRVNQGLLGEKGSLVKIRYHSFCENKMKTTEITRGAVQSGSDTLKDSRFISLKPESGELSSLMENSCDVTKGGDSKDQLATGEPQVLYVPIKSFSEKELCSKFRHVLAKDLKNKDSRGLIIDLRENSGGSLRSTVCMLDALVSSEGIAVGSKPVYDDFPNGFKVKAAADPVQSLNFSKSGLFSAAEVKRLTGKESKNPLQTYTYNRNVIVLVGGFSASASEIFAGVLQDLKRGWVVGRRTFGKGTVQILRTFKHRGQTPSDSEKGLVYKATKAVYVLPSGRSPQGGGITPDFNFKNDGKVETIEDSISSHGGEKSLYKSIVYDEVDWVQNRSDEVQSLKRCINELPQSHSETFLGIAENHIEFLFRSVGRSYALSYAKDLMSCADNREDLLASDL